MSLKEAREKIVHLRNEMRNESVRTEWINGYIDGLDEALYAIDDSSIDKVLDKLTLTELARKLRKIFRFKYLTCDGCDDQRDFCIWLDKPEYTRDGWTRYSPSEVVSLFESYLLAIQIDLSEYSDENGNIDYSKCIVEVE